MSELSMYILGVTPPDGCAMIRKIGADRNASGDWIKYNAGLVYKSEDVDKELKQLRAEVARLKRELEASAKQYQEACDDAHRFAVDNERLRKDAAIDAAK